MPPSPSTSSGVHNLTNFMLLHAGLALFIGIAGKNELIWSGSTSFVCVPACRAYGCDAPVGLVYGINPFMIIFMVPIIGAMTTNFAHFDMIHYGSEFVALSLGFSCTLCQSNQACLEEMLCSVWRRYAITLTELSCQSCREALDVLPYVCFAGYLSAISPFWIVAFPSHGVLLPLLQNNLVCFSLLEALLDPVVLCRAQGLCSAQHACMYGAEWSAVLFVITLSLGESIWSPRWYDYSMSLAPHGREGIFTALASAPLFAAKLPTGEPSFLIMLVPLSASRICLLQVASKVCFTV